MACIYVLLDGLFVCYGVYSCVQNRLVLNRHKKRVDHVQVTATDV